METKIPTLEEVKEYFKNAKEIYCLCNEKIIDVSDMELMERDFVFVFGYGVYSKARCFDKNTNEYAKIISYKDETTENIEHLETPKHYDNSKGTLYKVATERGWNPYLFDVVKRLERAEKKGEFKTDLEKSINVIKLWLEENGN